MAKATLEVEGSTGPSTSPTRGTAPVQAALYLSASQMDTFGRCENRWVLDRTGGPVNRASSEAMELGTLMHSLMGAWWSGRAWQSEWLSLAAEAVGCKMAELNWRLDATETTPTLVPQPGWEVPRIFVRAKPIMEAWDEVHGASPDQDPDPEWASAELIALELPFDLPIPGVKGARVRGFLDGLVATPQGGRRTNDVIRVLEFKTMGRWGREDRVPFDPQLLLYLWAAKQLMPNVQGAVFEAISTYAYKDGGPERRFKRIELPYDQRLIDLTIANVQKIARRGTQLLKNPGLAIRSVGEACTYCDHRGPCLTPWET